MTLNRVSVNLSATNVYFDFGTTGASRNSTDDAILGMIFAFKTSVEGLPKTAGSTTQELAGAWSTVRIWQADALPRMTLILRITWPPFIAADLLPWQMADNYSRRLENNHNWEFSQPTAVRAICRLEILLSEIRIFSIRARVGVESFGWNRVFELVPHP